MAKPRWEQILRLRLLGAPRHSSANDGASTLLIAAFAGIFPFCLVLSFLLPRVKLALTTFAVIFAGLSLQQYAWYTVYVFHECWEDEGPAIVAIIVMGSALLSVIALIGSILVSPFNCLVAHSVLWVAILTCFRWAPWGSFFDGTEKAQQERRVR